MAIITLTTDFGPGPFAGIMKGVILGIHPEARLVDLCHQVPPHEVRFGAVVLEQALETFPPGTVHLAVVDPGVGTERLPICVQSLGRFFVGPDNGLFTPALLADPGAKTWRLDNSDLFRHPVSRTFHGRDIFAPVAAHLALGLDPEKLGPRQKTPRLLDWPQPSQSANELTGIVTGEDSFGNLATNLPRRLVHGFLDGDPGVFKLGGFATIQGISHTYGQGEKGAPLALFNSLDRLEFALNQGNLRHRLGFDPGRAYGQTVRVTRVKH